MNKVDRSTINPKGHFKPFFSQLPIPECLKSGGIGAVVTLIVARSIHRKDMFQTHQNIIPKDNFKSAFLFSGANIPKFGMQAMLFHLFSTRIKKPDDSSSTKALKDLACSGAAGFLSTPIYSPFEHIALQYHTNNQNRSIREIFAELYSRKRIQYGLLPTSIRDLIFTCIYNSCAPQLSKAISAPLKYTDLSDGKLDFISTALGASTVGAVGGVLQTPADVLRAQRQHLALKNEIIPTYWQCAKKLGLKGLFVSWQTKASIGARGVPLFVLANKYLNQPIST